MKFRVELRKIQELFIFTEKEKRGIIVLLCLIFLLIIIDILLPLINGESKYDFTAWEKEMDQYFASDQPQEIRNTPFFNPSEVDSIKLARMGVPTRVAKNWCRYLEKGGIFKRKEDLKKIYGMTPELYNRLERFISIKEFKDEGNKVVEKIREVENGFTKGGQNENFYFVTGREIPQKKEIIPVNLNEADSAQLENLPGIGPVLAPRIIKFRKILGGYYSVEQLREIYGMRPENFLVVSPFLFVKEEGYQKFNINFSTLSELGRHPYIGYRTARRILDLRDKQGKFTGVMELSCLMGEDSLKKIAPYLVFGP